MKASVVEERSRLMFILFVRVQGDNYRVTRQRLTLPQRGTETLVTYPAPTLISNVDGSLLSLSLSLRL